MVPEGPGCQGVVVFRSATVDDLSALRDLEREANLVGLGHLFPADRYPFPEDAVLARWALVLDDPDVSVLVHDGEPGRRGHTIDVLVAYDHRTLRHLAVHPDRWGTGLATAAIQLALSAMAREGTTVAELWCLEENHRARRLYEHLGWEATDDRRPTPWPPHPMELRHTRRIARTER
jgi:GNAT superfamily N-acetyltransferase